MTDLQKAATIVICLALLVFGLACLLLPKSKQAWVLRLSAKGFIAPIKSVQNFIASPGYIASLRLGGAMAVLVALVVIFAMLRGSR